MKNIIFAAFVFTGSTAFAAPPSSECLNEAKSWIYTNTSANSSEAADRAIEFCVIGGDVSCLSPAKSWIYTNTSANNSEAAEKAVTFCKYGEVSCLDVTKQWVYQNTSANASQAADRAIEICGQRKECR